MRERSLLERAGLYLAMAAIAVNAPRLILAFLEVDGLEVPPSLRAGLLGLTGIATGVVLTGGGAFLAHAVAQGGRFRGLLAVTWLLVLTCGTALVAPTLAAGLSRETLDEVLPGSGLHWGWSAVAVVAVELVAAGSMVAHGRGEQGRKEQARLEEELLAVARERNRLSRELEQGGERVAPRLRAGRRASRPPAGAAKTAGVLPPGAAEVPCRNGCGWTGRSTMAECGHQRTCPLRR